jgi:hypothetical protein
MTKTKFAASSALIALLLSGTALASDKDTQELRAEIEAMRQSYESRIADLEAKLSKVEKATANQVAVKQAPAVASKEENKQPEAVARRPVFDNSFNPSIGVILNGRYSNFSTDTSELKGFGIGEEGERGTEGFGLGESELNLSASVDDKFAWFILQSSTVLKPRAYDKWSLIPRIWAKCIRGSGKSYILSNFNDDIKSIALVTECLL